MENEQAAPVTPRSVGIRYGLILSAISILYFVVLTVTGVDMTQGIGRWGGLIFPIVLIVLAHKNYKDNGNGFMSYSQGMGVVFWASLVNVVISSIFNWIYAKFIDTNYTQMLLDKQREAMEERGMSDAQIDQAMEMTAKFMTPEMILVFGLIFGLIILLIIGLIITAFTQKKNPEMPV